MRSIVVLPHPDGPTTQTNSPRRDGERDILQNRPAPEFEVYAPKRECRARRAQARSLAY